MSQKVQALTLVQHLEELRKRLFICIGCLLLTTIVSFAFADLLHAILLKPAGKLELIYVTPPEAMMANLRLAFMAGLVLSMPVLLFQLLAFITPGLHSHEKKIIIPAVLAIVVFFALGVLFAYYIAFPYAISFFMNFTSAQVKPMFTISNYLSFITKFLFGFGVIFELPILFLVLGTLHLVSAAFLRKNRKYALLIIAIVSAILTPPDVVSQIMMMFPLFLLYELGIWLVVFSQRVSRRKE